MGIALIITGTYSGNWQASLRALHAENGGKPDLLRFPGHVQEQALVDLYRGATCVVCPSRAEGFSIPIIEAMAMGAPVIASSIPAHAELIERRDLLASPDDDATVARLLERIANDPLFRSEIVSGYQGAWRRFRAPAVARRAWSAVVAQAARRPLLPPAAMVGRRRRPRVAILSPLPPDRSGVATYTAASLGEIGRHLDLHVFTETGNPLPVAGPQTIQPLSALPHLSSVFERVISVVGNSHFHLSIFQHLRRYGGACIAHDSRLLHFYHSCLGEVRCKEQAERELGRPLAGGEIDRWLRDESTLETQFLGEIAQISEPLLLHSKVTVRLVEERYQAHPVYLPFCIYREQAANALTPEARATARRRLEISDDTILIVSFGIVNASKAPGDCILALQILRAWGYAARLSFVGPAGADSETLRRLARRIGADGAVGLTEGFVDETTYTDFLLAADVGIQLRTHGFGGLSGALLDCIASGLPTVANKDLAEAMEAPGYVTRVPDLPSPLMIAEALAALVEEAGRSSRREEERLAYAHERSFTRYAQRLVAALGFDGNESLSRDC